MILMLLVVTVIRIFYNFNFIHNITSIEGLSIEISVVISPSGQTVQADSMFF